MPSNILGIAFPRDLVRESDNKRIGEYMRTPWFVPSHTEILQILKQFKQNKQDVAVVLNEKGEALGILHLEDIVEEIFGKAQLGAGVAKKYPNIPLIERTFPADTRIEEFNTLYDVHLESHGAETLGELVVKILGYHPEQDEVVYVPPFELIVKEVSLLEIKAITVKTRI